MILRQAVQNEQIIKKALRKRKMHLMKLLLKHKIYKLLDGRQLYELSIEELNSLLKEHQTKDDSNELCRF